MAVTHRQLINRVLQVLTEDEVSSSATELSTEYHKLVGTFTNQIREEVEDAWNWRKLRHAETVTILAGQDTVTVPNTNERSRLYREHLDHAGRERPLIFDLSNTATPFPIEEWDLPTLIYQRALNPNATNTFITAIAVDDTGGDLIDLQVYPAPTTDRTLQVHFITPQARFGNSTSDDPGLDTNILVPSRPVELGTLWYALEERGEELGVNAVFSERKYRQALDDAISRDAAEQGGIDLVPV